ncbi:GNAT family N-acetyltransferase [Kitasatospora sp. McL0602]|uniref:GNAT family N-acetyltransferase n=1 Tax=Kitasatospora sp. McL0602 TaxID=3439530 RepID=UPI003F8C0E65
MTTIADPMFTFPLGPDAVLIPRTADLAEPYHAVLTANLERLARWEPWALGENGLADTAAFMKARSHDWLDGKMLPVLIGVAAEGGWQLVGSAGVSIDAGARSAVVGYWIDAAFEGHGLVSRTVGALLDRCFGPLGLERVGLYTETANTRSRALATRLGFTEEGVLRGAIAFPGERRDQVVYGILAEEWRARRLAEQPEQPEA